MGVDGRLIGMILAVGAAFVGLTIGFSGSANALPAQVILLRHAEKPDSGEDLSPQGRERAQALVGFFETDRVVNEFGAPVAAYATSAGDGISARPIETIAPTAEALKLTLNSDYSQGQIDELVAAVRNNPLYDGRTVLICWHHGVIPKIAAAFGAEGVPAKWPNAVFDRIWVLRFSGGGVSLQNLPQHLLPGDSAQ